MPLAYQLRNLTVDYATTPVLGIAELAIAAGRITALAGPNGAGKSTLLQLLAFARPANTGNFLFFDTVVTPAALPTLGRQVALVQQNPYLLRGSVRANIELGLRLRGIPAPRRGVRVDRMIEMLSLGALALRKVNTLSGGEAQKVAIARALVLEPRVLLLDEPFTHLDRGFHSALENLLAELPRARDCTIVFSSHDLLRAQAIADEVFSLINGDTVRSSLVNLYRGSMAQGGRCFDTGQIQIILAGQHGQGTHLAIEPAHIVLSNNCLDSSIRNSFPGRISALTEAHGQVRVGVEAGEHFEALITHAALRQQGFSLGHQVWLSFKSSSVRVF